MMAISIIGLIAAVCLMLFADYRISASSNKRPGYFIFTVALMIFIGAFILSRIAISIQNDVNNSSDSIEEEEVDEIHHNHLKETAPIYNLMYGEEE